MTINPAKAAPIMHNRGVNENENAPFIPKEEPISIWAKNSTAIIEITDINVDMEIKEKDEAK